MSEKPWMKFFPADWRADPALRMCSVAARGVWMEVLCLMHEAAPRGSLLVNGQPVSERQLASLCGITPRETAACMHELQEAGVYSTDSDGTIFSRRMRRDDEKALRDKRNGSIGGNPNIVGGVNPPLNPRYNGGDKAQKLEARDQSKEKKEMFRTVAGATRPTVESHFEDFWKAYPSRGDRGNPKAPARKLFLAAVKRGVEPEKIIAAVRSFVGFDRQKVGTEFIPQAVKWLRDERFGDALPPPEPAAQTEKTEIPGKVYVKQSEALWDVMEARHMAEKRSDPPTDRDGGWYFPAEWVPQHETVQ